MKDIISSQEVKALIAKGAQLLDVRSAREFCQDALQGAINLPLDALLKGISGLDEGKPVKSWV